MLVSSQTAAKGGHDFEIAARMENLRGWDWDETQNGAHRVRNLQLNTGIAHRGKHYRPKPDEPTTYQRHLV